MILRSCEYCGHLSECFTMEFSTHTVDNTCDVCAIENAKKSHIPGDYCALCPIKAQKIQVGDLIYASDVRDFLLVIEELEDSFMCKVINKSFYNIQKRTMVISKTSRMTRLGLTDAISDRELELIEPKETEPIVWYGFLSRVNAGVFDGEDYKRVVVEKDGDNYKLEIENEDGSFNVLSPYPKYKVRRVLDYFESEGYDLSFDRESIYDDLWPDEVKDTLEV